MSTLTLIRMGVGQKLFRTGRPKRTYTCSVSRLLFMRFFFCCVPTALVVLLCLSLLLLLVFLLLRVVMLSSLLLPVAVVTDVACVFAFA